MLSGINSKYIIKTIFNHLEEVKILGLVKYNKEFQQKIGLTIENYINFKRIEIVITIDQYFYSKQNQTYSQLNFIRYNEKDQPYFHIYFDDRIEEAKKNYIRLNEKVSKVKISIDPKVKSIMELFYNCLFVEKIKFIKYNRADLTKLTYLFFECEHLIDLDITKLETQNVTNMNGMFRDCRNLVSLDLSNLKTCKVKDMSNLFSSCIRLRY